MHEMRGSARWLLSVGRGLLSYIYEQHKTVSAASVRHMNLSRIALITAAAGFAGFGVACLIRPKGMLEAVDIRARSARGATELRAMYGGLEVGLGAFFATAAAKPEWTRPALLAQTLGLGALAASRLGGILRDHPRGSLMKGLFIAESSAAALAGVALATGRERTVAGLRAA